MKMKSSPPALQHSDEIISLDPENFPIHFKMFMWATEQRGRPRQQPQPTHLLVSISEALMLKSFKEKKLAPDNICSACSLTALEDVLITLTFLQHKERTKTSLRRRSDQVWKTAFIFNRVSKMTARERKWLTLVMWTVWGCWLSHYRRCFSSAHRENDRRCVQFTAHTPNILCQFLWHTLSH